MSTSDLARTVAILEALEVAHAVFGAMAMAVYGVARATLDLDLLVFDRRVLDPATWTPLSAARVPFDVRSSHDDTDPVVGVVRIAPRRRLPIDVVMPRGARHVPVLERARSNPHRMRVLDVDLPVVELADLVLLKLDAGGPGDRDDARRLLAVADPGVRAVVQDRVRDWPVEVLVGWERLLSE